MPLAEKGTSDIFIFYILIKEHIFVVAQKKIIMLIWFSVI